MAKPALTSEMKKGSAELLILAILEDGQRHGYEIARQIEGRSRGAISFHVASLYPTTIFGRALAKSPSTRGSMRAEPNPPRVKMIARTSGSASALRSAPARCRSLPAKCPWRANAWRYNRTSKPSRSSWRAPRRIRAGRAADAGATTATTSPAARADGRRGARRQSARITRSDPPPRRTSRARA